MYLCFVSTLRQCYTHLILHYPHPDPEAEDSAVGLEKVPLGILGN